MLLDLVLKHLLDGLGLEDLCACFGRLAVVEEGCEDLAVFSGFGETSGAFDIRQSVMFPRLCFLEGILLTSTVEDALLVVFGLYEERFTVDVISCLAC